MSAPERPKYPCTCPCNCSYSVGRPWASCWPCGLDTHDHGLETHLTKITRMREAAARPEQEYCLCGGTIVETEEGIECAVCHVRAPKVVAS